MPDHRERTHWLESHDERHPVLLAMVDGKVVGWASPARWSERRAYDDTAETSFYVHSTYRGRGIDDLAQAEKEKTPQRHDGHREDLTSSLCFSLRLSRLRGVPLPSAPDGVFGFPIIWEKIFTIVAGVRVQIIPAVGNWDCSDLDTVPHRKEAGSLGKTPGCRLDNHGRRTTHSYAT
jgi:hypothetical protein